MQHGHAALAATFEPSPCCERQPRGAKCRPGCGAAICWPASEPGCFPAAAPGCTSRARGQGAAYYCHTADVYFPAAYPPPHFADYFSRHSYGGGLLSPFVHPPIIPFPVPMGGGAAGAEEAAAGAGDAAGAAGAAAGAEEAAAGAGAGAEAPQQPPAEGAGEPLERDLGGDDWPWSRQQEAEVGGWEGERVQGECVGRVLGRSGCGDGAAPPAPPAWRPVAGSARCPGSNLCAVALF